MAARYYKVLKRKDFSGVVKKEKDKGKDKTMTEDKGKRKGVYPPAPYVWGDTDGKSRQDRSWEREKAAKADNPKTGADVGNIHKSCG